MITDDNFPPTITDSNVLPTSCIEFKRTLRSQISSQTFNSIKNHTQWNMNPECTPYIFCLILFREGAERKNWRGRDKHFSPPIQSSTLISCGSIFCSVDLIFSSKANLSSLDLSISLVDLPNFVGTYLPLIKKLLLQSIPHI